jgi:hypothetical protein
LLSAREKMPFEVTPMFPYLTRWSQSPSAGQSGTSNGTAPVTTPAPSAEVKAAETPSPQPQ